jgi:D-glycero-D-manno-heptose 1,7-bisphosphate phosphatase
MKKRAVFLDRDGVLNKAIVVDGKPYPPDSLQALEIPSDVPQALQQLKQAGYLLIAVTNQPDVARGKTQPSLVQAINDALIKQLPLDEFHVCYHDDQDNCDCRKPAPGFLLMAAKNHNLDLSHSIMIGDRWSDIEAGQRANCKTIWLNYGYKEAAPRKPPDFTASFLHEAADWIMNNK